MATPNVWGLTESQLKRLGEMLAAFESGTLWPSEKPIQRPRSELARVRFHNDSGETIPAWGVMRITGVETGNDAWRLKVGKPNTTFYNVYLVNAGFDVTTSTDGWGTYLWHSGHVLSDSTYVPTIGQEWGPTSGSWALVRYRPGFLIDGGPTGSGSTYRAVAKQRIVTLLRGITTTTLVEGGSCTVNLRLRNAATGERENTGILVTAYDDFLGPGDTWPVSTRVVIDFEGGIWNVIQASCDPDSGGGGGGAGPSSQSAATINAGGNLFANGFTATGSQLFSGSTDGKDYDSLFNSA